MVLLLHRRCLLLIFSSCFEIMYIDKSRVSLTNLPEYTVFIWRQYGFIRAIESACIMLGAALLCNVHNIETNAQIEQSHSFRYFVYFQVYGIYHILI